MKLVGLLLLSAAVHTVSSLLRIKSKRRRPDPQEEIDAAVEDAVKQGAYRSRIRECSLPN